MNEEDEEIIEVHLPPRSKFKKGDTVKYLNFINHRPIVTVRKIEKIIRNYKGDYLYGFTTPLLDHDYLWVQESSISKA